jgi:L-threonylcarbamoyladenylate synthase
MKVIKLTKANFGEVVKQACDVLAKGGLVVYPTETCYGLGADATNANAVAKLLKYKRRREGKPLSVLVAGKSEAQQYVDLNKSAGNLYKRFLPGPVTVVSYMRKGKLADGVASELGTVGIRISSHPVAQALAKSYGKPITATSANASWKKKPYSVEDILSPLSEVQKNKLDLVIDARELPQNETSTVVDTTLVGDMVLRAGSIQVGSEKIVSHSPEETRAIAMRLALKHWNEMRKTGLVLALSGELGAGKTIFAQGIGEFLGVESKVVSPSYTLVHEYQFEKNGVKGMFFHLDPWRLGSVEELLSVGLEKMFVPNTIVVIEWASKYLDKLREVSKVSGVRLVEVGIKGVGEGTRELSF